MKITLDHVRGFDFHCHVDLHRDPPGVVSRCERERIVTVAVTTTPMAWPQNRAWTARSRYVHAALGLHPELVGDRYEEVRLLEEGIKEARVIGEVGLDGSPQHSASFARQREVFGRVLDAAQAQSGRILTIHSRRAARETIELIETKSSVDRVLPILHWFSGNPSEVARALKHGCYFSVNAAMLGSDRGRALILEIPTERLLTETDSPFTRTGKAKSQPWDVALAAAEVARLSNMPEAHMLQVLTDNARRVLRFAGLVDE